MNWIKTHLRRLKEQTCECFNLPLARDAKGQKIYIGSLVDDIYDVPYEHPMYVAGIFDGLLTVMHGCIVGDRDPKKVVVVGWRS